MEWPVSHSLFYQFQVFYYKIGTLLVLFIQFNIINVTRMRYKEILIGSHVWSRQIDFNWIVFIFSSGQYDTE